MLLLQLPLTWIKNLEIQWACFYGKGTGLIRLVLVGLSVRQSVSTYGWHVAATKQLPWICFCIVYTSSVPLRPSLPALILAVFCFVFFGGAFYLHLMLNYKLFYFSSYVDRILVYLSRDWKWVLQRKPWACTWGTK